jgi:hypothetical protein
MSIQKVTADDFETFTLVTNPRRTYVSSSVNGVTGSVNLFARRSEIQKEIYPLSLFSASLYNDQNLDELRKDILSLTSSNITSSIETYLNAVNAQQTSARLNQKLEIIRFDPPFRFNSNTGRKLTVINTLMPYYRTKYPTANFSYTNYHCLNFYSASNVPTGSVYLYPNPFREDDNSITQYGFSGSFSFDFWIKPKYSSVNGKYQPGTIMHLTNSYALSLVSGSARDINGNTSGFRILLQLSSSADIAPDAITPGTYAIFSNDNSIPINEWSHVTVRWGGPSYNYGTGSFIINGVQQGLFVITASMAVGVTGSGIKPDPYVMAVGNYYQGSNYGTDSLSWFFSHPVAYREGLYELETDPSQEQPIRYSFNYPLKAEVHELKLYDKYLNNSEIESLSTKGPELETNLRFYLPPFFTEESPYRRFDGMQGGIPVTPFFGKDGTTYQPFATDMAFGCGGHFINLENYVRDFATGRYPRLLNLTSSFYNQTTPVALSANAYLYSTGSNIKRQYSILPNDNGKFYPNFNLLRPLSGSTFVDDLGIYTPGLISLRNMITGTFPADVLVEQNSIGAALAGGNNPEDFGSVPGTSLTIYNRTKDGTSNQIVFFDISNMFYGNRINPGTFVMTDSDLSGSSGSVGLVIKDDLYGNLYRADVTGSCATWASIGNIFYDEGIILLKMPQLYFFGSKQYYIEFQGIQNIHVLTVNAYARPLQLISSSYAAYQTGSIDDVSNNTDDSYVFISNVLLHDDNLNVIGRTSVAQPILKRSGDKFLFKIKMDY